MTSVIINRQIQELVELGNKLKEFGDTAFYITLADFRAKLLPILTTVGENFNIDAWERVVENAARDVIVVRDVMRSDELGNEVIYHIPAIIRQLETSAATGDRLGDFQKEMQNLQVDQPTVHADVVYTQMVATRGNDEPEALSAKRMADVLVKIFTDHGIALPEHLQHGVSEDAQAPSAENPQQDQYETINELP